MQLSCRVLFSAGLILVGRISMLLNLREYHRPVAAISVVQTSALGAALRRALALLARPGLRTVALAAGDTLVAESAVSSDAAGVDAVVDLQEAGLDGLTFERTDLMTGHLRIGAMVTRAALCTDIPADCPVPYRSLLSQAAHRWGGSVQRNRATVGGSLAVAASEDALVAALLACDANVVLYDATGFHELPLADFLPQRATLLAQPALIVEARVTPIAGATGSALAMVARTPADAPIVLAAAVLTRAGDTCTAVRLALGGIVAAPFRATNVEAALTGQALTAESIAAAAQRVIGDLPTGSAVLSDYRGSAEYRAAMAETLARRALGEAWATA
jgi:aerobic carbon-monoxide dehydrogenase medium subunit